MSFNLPKSAVDVDKRAKTDVQRSLTGSNPFLKNSWLGSLVTAFSNRIFDFYLQLEILLRQMFWDKSTGEFLEIQASWFKIQRLAAVQSTGSAAATGTAGSSIPIGTEFKTKDGLKFTSIDSAVITNGTINVSSITLSGQTATVKTVADHNLSSFVPVTISGANQAEYNVTDADITVTALDEFTYTITGSPVTPATGTISAGFASAKANIKSVEFGEDNNLSADTILTLVSPLSGVDNDIYVNFGEVSGGIDQENDTDLRSRFLSRVQNPISHFNAAEITNKAKEINGVTRVFVQETTPLIGQVTIYIMRDNDDDPIPDAAEIVTVKNKILEVKPANTSDLDVIVSAPSAVTTNFVFTALSPDTSTMREAIEANLKNYFTEFPLIGEDINEDAYRSIIFNTVDTATGDVVKTFTISAPTGSIVVTAGQIATLGTVTYP